MTSAQRLLVILVLLFFIAMLIAPNVFGTAFLIVAVGWLVTEHIDELNKTREGAENE